MIAVNKTLNSIMRPKNLDKLILLDRIRKIVGDGTLSTNLLLVSSSPGTGKTSLSKILANDRPYLYINVSEEGRIEFLRDQLTEFCETRSMFKVDFDYKVVIFDEFDGASDVFYKALRPFIEKYEDRVRFVATCNYIEKLPDPILSRFAKIEFYPLGEDEEKELYSKYVKRINGVTKKLGMDWESKEILLEFIKRDFPDLRALFTKLQTLNISGIKTISIDDVKRSAFLLEEIFSLLVSKPNPIENYRLIMGKYSSKVSDVFLSLSSDFPNWLEENRPDLMIELSKVLITVAEWEFKSRSSIDPVLHLLACIFSIQNYLVK